MSSNSEELVYESKCRRIGNSLGVILPKAVIGALHLDEGAKIELRVINGAIVIAAIDEDEKELLFDSIKAFLSS